MENVNVNVRNEKAVTELATLIKNHFVGFDTNIFMHDSAEIFFPMLKKVLLTEKRIVFTIGEVYEELKKQANSDNQDKRTKAQRGLCYLKELVAAKVLVVYESAAVNVPFADAAWLSLFAQMRLKHKIVLVTQDRKLAKNVIEANGADSVNANIVKVRRINNAGYLSSFHFTYDENGHIIEMPTSSTLNKLALADDFPLPAVTVDEGEKVYTETRNVYTLGEEMNYGREGSIWALENAPTMLAKIFTAPTNRKFEKVRYLCSLPPIEGAVLPREIITDASGNFVGYIMEKVNGVAVEALFTTKGQERNAPHWNRKDYVTMARSIVRVCSRLQNAGILVGDVNGSNFLIGRSENDMLDADKIYAIDLDSCQAANKRMLFPSEGITLNYAAPEYLREGIPAKGLRSNESFQYSAALLALQCVLCGVHPFRVCSEDAASTIQDAMKTEQLPFGTADVRRAGVSPSGVEKLWSNMPAGTKTFFHSIFQKGGDRNAAEKRPSMKTIEKELSNYITWIEDQTNQAQFPEILSTQPLNLKPFYANCANKGCDHRFVVEKFRPDGRYFCPECLERWHNGIAGYKICGCGSVFAVRNFEKKADPTLCPTCRSRMEVPDQTPAPAIEEVSYHTMPSRSTAASTPRNTSAPKTYSPKHATPSVNKQPSFFEFLKQSIGF